MISSISQGRGYGGVVRYVAEKEGAEYVAGNTMGETPAEIAKEMNETRDAYEGRAKKTVFHASLNPDAGDQINDPKKMGEDYLRGMGMDPEKHEYAMYRHTDTGREHYHIIANRVSRDGSSIASDKNNFQRSHNACRELEKKYGLKEHQQKGRYHESNKEEKGMAERKGWDRHPKEVIRNASRSATGEAKSLDQYKDEMKKRGVDVHERKNKAGEVSGYSYSLDKSHGDKADGKKHSGSNLGDMYTPKGVQYDINQKKFLKECIEYSKGETNGRNEFAKNMHEEHNIKCSWDNNGKIQYDVNGSSGRSVYSGSELGEGCSYDINNAKNKGVGSGLEQGGVCESISAPNVTGMLENMSSQGGGKKKKENKNGGRIYDPLTRAQMKNAKLNKEANRGRGKK